MKKKLGGPSWAKAAKDKGMSLADYTAWRMSRRGKKAAKRVRGPKTDRDGRLATSTDAETRAAKAADGPPRDVPLDRMMSGLNALLTLSAIERRLGKLARDILNAEGGK